MKYIILKRKFAGCEQEIPIIFPNYLVHKDIATALLNSLSLSKCEVVSAGECNSLDLSVIKDSKSDTLNLVSRKDDEKIIQMHDYLAGIVS